MYNNNSPELDTNFTVVVSILAGMSEVTHFAKVRPFEVAPELFKFFPEGLGRTWPNELKVNSVVTQLVLTKLSEADDSSKNQQLGRFTYKGKNKVWPIKPIEDQIAAEVISQIWDRVSGKLEGSSFTYKSDVLQFSAIFDSARNKYHINY